MDISESISTVSRSTSKTTDWTWENILTYQKKFKEIHDLTVMGAMSARDYNNDNFSVTKQNVPIESEEFWYFDSATDNPQAGGRGSSLSMLSFLGRINYSLYDRYLLTASIRGDGSSRFIGSNRWGVFPSAAFAWKINEESFFKEMDQNVLSSAKFRLGYGEIGNENINSYYPYNTPITQRQYYTTGKTPQRLNGALPNGIGNTAAKWETSTQSNIGLDLAFLKGKFTVTADYFIRKTDDILLSQSIPIVSGFGSMIRNVGGMENKGVELTVGYKEKRGDFGYNISANATFIKNKVTNLGTATALTSSFDYDYVLIDLQGAFPNMLRSEVGLPFRQFYGYQTAGIFQNQAEIDAYTHNGEKIQADAAPGDFKYVDKNGNGRVDTGDMDFIGNPIPDATFGLSLDANYKNFDINMLFQGVVGNDIFNASRYYFMRFDGRHNARTEILDSYWHGENTSNTQPIVTNNVARNNRNYRVSDYYVEDGSYVRLKSIQLGYKFTPNFAGLKTSIRFYISAQNLFTLTKYTGYEVEVPDISVDRGQYPQPRTFMIGTMIDF
jgi:TonB-linked SusC/RagA family outer membrane protein